MTNQILEYSRELESSLRALSRGSDADRIAEAISSAVTGGELLCNLRVVIREILRTQIDPHQRRLALMIDQQIRSAWLPGVG